MYMYLALPETHLYFMFTWLAVNLSPGVTAKVQLTSKRNQQEFCTFSSGQSHLQVLVLQSEWSEWNQTTRGDTHQLLLVTNQWVPKRLHDHVTVINQLECCDSEQVLESTGGEIFLLMTWSQLPVLVKSSHQGAILHRLLLAPPAGSSSSLDILFTKLQS